MFILSGTIVLMALGSKALDELGLPTNSVKKIVEVEVEGEEEVGGLRVT